jgi:hypothetical protein
MVFSLIAFGYFVILPAWTGKTLGLSLLGCHLETTETGEKPGLREASLRLVGLVLVYATFGLMLLPVLRGVHLPLFQDRLSGTRVVPKPTA